MGDRSEKRRKSLPHPARSHSLLIHRTLSEGLPKIDPQWVADFLAKLGPQTDSVSRKVSRKEPAKRPLPKTLPRRLREETAVPRRPPSEKRIFLDQPEPVSDVPEETSLQKASRLAGPAIPQSYYVGKSHCYSMGDALPLLEYYVGRYKMRCSDLKEEQAKQKRVTEAQYEVERGLRVDVATKTSEIEALMNDIERQKSDWKKQEMRKAMICQAYNAELDRLMKEVVMQRYKHNELNRLTIDLQSRALRRTPVKIDSASLSLPSSNGSSIDSFSTVAFYSEDSETRHNAERQSVMVAHCPDIQWTYAPHTRHSIDRLSTHSSHTQHHKSKRKDTNHETDRHHNHLLSDFSDAHTSELDWAAGEESMFTQWLSSASANRLRKPEDWRSFLNDAPAKAPKGRDQLAETMEDHSTSVGPSPTSMSGISPLSASITTTKKRSPFTITKTATEIPNCVSRLSSQGIHSLHDSCSLLNSPRSARGKHVKAVTQAVIIPSDEILSSPKSSCFAVTPPSCIEITPQPLTTGNSITLPALKRVPSVCDNVHMFTDAITPPSVEDQFLLQSSTEGFRDFMYRGPTTNDLTTSFMSGHSEPAPRVASFVDEDITESAMPPVYLSSELSAQANPEEDSQRWRDVMTLCEEVLRRPHPQPVAEAATEVKRKPQRTSSVPLRTTPRLLRSRRTFPARRVEDCHFAQMTSSFAAKLRRESPEPVEAPVARPARPQRSMPSGTVDVGVRRLSSAALGRSTEPAESIPRSTPPFRGRAVQRACAAAARIGLPAQLSPRMSNRGSSPPSFRVGAQPALPKVSPVRPIAESQYGQPVNPPSLVPPLESENAQDRSSSCCLPQASRPESRRRVGAIPLGLRALPHFNSEFRIVSRMLTVPANTDQLFPCSIVRQQQT